MSGYYEVMKEMALLYTTIGSLQQARELAIQLIELKIASCVNIIPQLESIYYWHGRVESSQESGLLIKATTDKLAQLIEWLENNHPYDTPAIIRLDAECHEKFYQFLSGQ